MATLREQIQTMAIKFLKQKPEGIRQGELGRMIRETNATFNPNTIGGAIWNLDQLFSNQVYKPSRGVFRLVEFQDSETVEVAEQLEPKNAKGVREEEFYKPFADWLLETGDCTKVIVLGGNRFRDKWGTPDAIGKWETGRTDIIPGGPEIVSAEIKSETGQSITAFGQACSYCLFSHRSYMVVPQQSSPDERDRLTSLCLVFGIGLVFFDATNPNEPNFELCVRPKNQKPDLFYANRYMRMIEKELFS